MRFGGTRGAQRKVTSERTPDQRGMKRLTMGTDRSFRVAPTSVRRYVYPRYHHRCTGADELVIPNRVPASADRSATDLLVPIEGPLPGR